MPLLDSYLILHGEVAVGFGLDPQAEMGLQWWQKHGGNDGIVVYLKQVLILKRKDLSRRPHHLEAPASSQSRW